MSPGDSKLDGVLEMHLRKWPKPVTHTLYITTQGASAVNVMKVRLSFISGMQAIYCLHKIVHSELLTSKGVMVAAVFLCMHLFYSLIRNTINAVATWKRAQKTNYDSIFVILGFYKS